MKAQEFLEQEGIGADIVVDARKQSFGQDDLCKLIAGMDELYSMKGKKIVHIDLRKQKPSQAELAAAMLGPTGNLRAPAMRKGKTLIVGFNEEAYRRLFG